MNDAIELLLKQPGPIRETGGIKHPQRHGRADAKPASPRPTPDGATTTKTMKTSKRSILPCPIVSPCRPNSHFPKHVRHATTYNLYPHADIPFEFPHRNSGAVLASCQCVGRIVSYKCLRSSPRRIAYYSLGIVNRRTDRACRLTATVHRHASC